MNNVEARTNSEQLRIMEFWGRPHPKPVDNTVYVWTDTDQLKFGHLKQSKLYGENGDENSSDTELGYSTKLQRMGASRSNEKQKRMMVLTKLIDDKKVKTVQEALSMMEDIRTEKTIKDYLKIIGRKLLDENTNQIIGSDEPQYYLLDAKNGGKSKRLATEYKYYSSDPSLGGKEISKEEYLKLREDLRKNFKKVGN